MKRVLFLALILLAGVLSAQTLPTCYYTYAQVTDMLNAYQAQYPAIAKVYTIGYTQQEHLPIYAMKISDNVELEEDEPAVLFIGQVHAEEVMGVQIVMSNINEILTLNEQALQSLWKNQLEMWFIPTLNPEGHNVVTSNIDNSYRKNKRDNNGNGIFDFSNLVGYDIDGVDINRNLDFNWVHGDTLMQPGSLEVYDYYRGPYPDSESEVHALKELCDAQRFVYSIVWHSSRTGNLSEKVYYPFNWKEVRPSPDMLFAQSIAQGVASQIYTQAGDATYEYLPNLSRRGATHDWMYQQYGTIQMLIECATRDIQPDSLIMVDTVNRCSNGVRWLLKRALMFSQGSVPVAMMQGKVTDIVTGQPLQAQIVITEHDAPWFRPRTSDPATGQYFKPLATGTYHLKVLKEGYQDFTATVMVNANTWTLKNVQMQPKVVAYFAGTVSGNGQPINARIIFKDMDPDTIVTNGSFVHSSYVGSYQVEVSAEGYYPYLGTVTLQEGYNNFLFNLSPTMTIFSEDWEEGTSAWTIVGPWVRENELSASGYAITDSWGGNGFYETNASVYITTNDSFFIPSSEDAMLVFDSHLYTEWSWDPCTVEISTDGGNNWTVVWTKSGLWNSWRIEYVPLSDYPGMNVKIRFHLTDVSTHADLTDPGWTIDNIRLVRGLSGYVATTDPLETPIVSALYPNYPNPFNPTTTISYSLATAQNVSLDIFNMRGQRIRSLVNGTTPAGDHSVVWNGTDDSGRNLPSGVYFYRLSTPEKTTTLKMVMVK